MADGIKPLQVYVLAVTSITNVRHHNSLVNEGFNKGPSDAFKK